MSKKALQGSNRSWPFDGPLFQDMYTLNFVQERSHRRDSEIAEKEFLSEFLRGEF